MTVIARRIRANPVRTTGETWQFITDLICSSGDLMRTQLDEAANVAAMLISEEYAKSHPIIVSGCGPQIRIYTLHGEVAIDGTEAKEDELLIVADDDWEISLPAEGNDFEFASGVFSDISNIIAYDSSAN